MHKLACLFFVCGHICTDLYQNLFGGPLICYISKLSVAGFFAATVSPIWLVKSSKGQQKGLKTGIRGVQDSRQISYGKTNDFENDNKKGTQPGPQDVTDTRIVVSLNEESKTETENKYVVTETQSRLSLISVRV